MTEATDFSVLEAWLAEGKVTEVLAQIERAPQPGDPRWHAMRVSLLAHLRQGQAALEAARQSVRDCPESGLLHFNLACLFEDHGDDNAALRAYETALEHAPALADAAHNRVLLLMRVGRTREAVDSMADNVRRYPQDVRCWKNLAEVRFSERNFIAAGQAAQQAVSLQPESAEGYFLQGLVLAAEGQLEAAQKVFDQAREVDPEGWSRCRSPLFADLGGDRAPPDPGRVWLAMWLNRQKAADWDSATHAAKVAERWFSGELEVPPPGQSDLAYPSLLLPVSPAARAALTRRLAGNLRRQITEIPRALSRERRAPIRIGYISPNFREHASSYLVHGLFAAHDRERFEVYGYALGEDSGCELRRHIAAGCDRFRSLDGMTDLAAAQQIAADGVDILIEMGGFNHGTRPAITMHRPAPVTVSYLDYPGSLGGLSDYTLVDATSCPEAEAELWPEAVGWMPHTFYVVSPLGALAPVPEREVLGLPGSGMVYANFNMPWKLEEESFALWMAVLRAAPGSVLWLIDGGAEARENLRRFAERSGVSGDRLVFAAQLARSEYLSRLQAADLVLDTLCCNAMTTAVDALQVGVPVLTCAGEAMVSRVAASLVCAAGLPQGAAGNREEYLTCAVTLAQDRAGEWKRQLAEARSSAPLFDFSARVRALEHACEAMWVRHLAGLPPASFEVQG